MGNPHKHAAVIKAWADGAEIEYRRPNKYGLNGEWMPITGLYMTDIWSTELELRVKPEKVVLYVNANVGAGGSPYRCSNDNLALTFRDGKLVYAEVL